MQMASKLFLVFLLVTALVISYESLFYQDSKTTAINSLGIIGFILLCASLMIGPLAVMWPKTYAQLIEPRRAIGLAAFIFAGMHTVIAIWLIFGWNLGPLTSSAPLLVAVPAILIFLALAMASNDYSFSKLGAGTWKNIQRLNYALFILSSAHFILEARGLFASVNGKVFLDLNELLALMLLIATVLLQIAGYSRKRAQLERKSEPQPVAGEESKSGT